MTGRREFLARWSELHDGIDSDTSWLLRNWLRLVYPAARALASAGSSPNVVTSLGLLIACVVPMSAAIALLTSQPQWLWLATLSCLATGFVDSLDGAVAILAGRVTPWGSVLDSVVDRLSEYALLAALWLVGAPGIACVIAGALGTIQEYARARANAVGTTGFGVIGISERPTRLSIVGVFLGLSVWQPFGVSGATWVTGGAWIAVAVATVGALQVLAALRRDMTNSA